jgi:hypothetical protein
MLTSERKESTISPKSSNKPLLINGLSYKVYNNGMLVSKMQAEVFKIKPRRFFIFNIKSINEAILTNVKIDVYINKKTKEGKEIKKDIDLLKLFFDSTTGRNKGMGLITRAMIKGIDLNIYNSDVLTHNLKAATAYFMLKKNKIVFYNVNLENPPSHKLISAEEIIWDAREKSFKVPDRYTASSPKGKIKGKGLIIDLDFNIKP